MFCSNCMKELNEGAKFCSNCGSAFGAASVPSGIKATVEDEGISDADMKEAERLQEEADNYYAKEQEERFTEEQVDEELEKYTRNVTEDDVSGVLEKEGKILDKAHGPLEKFTHNIKMLFSLIKDYSQGTYRQLPWTTIAAIVGCLLYIFSPIDLIPDFIPVLGLTDDAAVFAAMLSSGVGSDIKKYEQWKSSRRKQRLKMFEDVEFPFE